MGKQWWTLPSMTEAAAKGGRGFQRCRLGRQALCRLVIASTSSSIGVAEGRRTKLISCRPRPRRGGPGLTDTLEPTSMRLDGAQGPHSRRTVFMTGNTHGRPFLLSILLSRRHSAQPATFALP